MVDLVLVMTVNPGFGGQSFIENTLGKIEELAILREQHGYHYEIEVDGGIQPDTKHVFVLKQSADVFVAGSYVYNHENPKGQLAKLREAVSE